MHKDHDEYPHTCRNSLCRNSLCRNSLFWLQITITCDGVAGAQFVSVTESAFDSIITTVSLIEYRPPFYQQTSKRRCGTKDAKTSIDSQHQFNQSQAWTNWQLSGPLYRVSCNRLRETKDLKLLRDSGTVPRSNLHLVQSLRDRKPPAWSVLNVDRRNWKEQRG